MQSKIPNLGRYDDISDVLVAGGNASESSEGEDEDAKVQLPQSISSRGNVAAQVHLICKVLARLFFARVKLKKKGNLVINF